MKRRNIYVILALAMCLLSCSAERRINRIAERNGLARVRTEVVRDTVTIAGFDTLIVVPTVNGIFKASAGNVGVTGIIKGDTVFVRIKEKGDTLYIEKEIPYNWIDASENQQTPVAFWFMQLGQFLFSICILLIIIKALKK